MKVESIIGLDLGQKNDYTVLSLVNLVHNTSNKHDMLYELIFLKRFRLQTPYPKIVEWITIFINKNFIDTSYIMIVDYTGVGRPVVDLLREAHLNIIALNITSGNICSWKAGKEVNVPKKELISSMQVVLQNSRIKIAADLKDLELLKKEFLNFKVKISKSADAKFNASSGYHDDIVMSICLAIWYGEYASKKGRRLRIISGN